MISPCVLAAPVCAVLVVSLCGLVNLRVVFYGTVCCSCSLCVRFPVGLCVLVNVKSIGSCWFCVCC